ncbi:Adenylate cyclase type 2, partial [Taenia solium]
GFPSRIDCRSLFIPIETNFPFGSLLMESSVGGAVGDEDSFFEYVLLITCRRLAFTERSPVGGSTCRMERELTTRQTRCEESKKTHTKKDVAARSSKGRQIRYLKIPKAIDFMCPVVVNHFSDVQRENILRQMKATLPGEIFVAGVCVVLARMFGRFGCLASKSAATQWSLVLGCRRPGEAELGGGGCSQHAHDRVHPSMCVRTAGFSGLGGHVVLAGCLLGGDFAWTKPNWQDYKIEHPAVVRHVKRLQELGLKDPWVRNYVWVYSPRIYKTPWQVCKSCFFKRLPHGLAIAIAYTIGQTAFLKCYRLTTLNVIRIAHYLIWIRSSFTHSLVFRVQYFVLTTGSGQLGDYIALAGWAGLRAMQAASRTPTPEYVFRPELVPGPLCGKISFTFGWRMTRLGIGAEVINALGGVLQCDKMMPAEILKETLLSVIFKVAHHVGFEVASIEAADILSEVLLKYMQSISKSVADLAVEDGFFSVIDGITILELMKEPLPNLVKYARESGSYFPRPPNMYIPLVGRMESDVSFVRDKTISVSSHTLLRESLCSKDEIGSLTENKVESTNGQTSVAVQGRNDRKLPLWASKVKYKLACVSYDPSLGSVVEHGIPPPATSVIPSVKRYSSRSTVSAFRKPQASPLLFDSDYSSDVLAHSNKQPRATDAMREGALKVFTQSPPRMSRKPGCNASPSVSINPSDVALADATPTASSTDTKSICSSSIADKSRRRNSQNRKKRFGFGRRRFQSIGKQTTQPTKPPMSPVVEIAKVTKASDHPTPDDKKDNSAAPILADALSPCPYSEFKTDVGNPNTVTLDHATAGSHASDVHVASLTGFILLPRFEQFLIRAGSISMRTVLLLCHPKHQSRQYQSKAHYSMVLQSRPTPQIPETLTQARLGSAERGGEALSMASSSNNGCIKSEGLYSPTSSGSCTEPLTNEELSRDYEMPRVFNFPPTRRSSFSPSSSSPSSSSPSSSSSSSPISDSSKAVVPSVPMVVTSSSLRVPSQLPIQQPSSDHSSRASSSLPGSLASRQPTSATGYVAEAAEIPHTASAMGGGGGIRIKIRLGGPDGETMSVRSSEPAFTNTNSSSSTSSSSVSSPLSSAQVSDEETTARRHSAIPPALVAKEKRHEPTPSFGSLISKIQPRAPSMSQQSSLSVKTPKLVIKFGGHEHGSTSIVRPLDQQILRLKPAFAHEKLRGSSISSMGSSSSSSSSQTSDDEDEAPVPRPPHLPVLERLPSVRTSGNRSSQPPALSLLKDPSSKVPSSISNCKKLPPQLRPLHIIPSLIPVLKPSVVAPKTTTYSPASPFGQCSNKSSSKHGKKGSRKRYMSQSPPKLGVCHSACGKRVLVDSIFSDDEEEDAIVNTGDSLSMRSRDSHRSHEGGRHSSKRRKLEGDRAQTPSQISPPTTQIIAASAGTSYYFNNAGEQIWLCPICRTEDDGNLMVGCDSCDDWYHSCLGLSKEPDSAQWFCPKCLRERLDKSTTNSINLEDPINLQATFYFKDLLQLGSARVETWASSAVIYLNKDCHTAKMAAHKAQDNGNEVPRSSSRSNKFRFHLFERCSGGVLNLRFDSTVLESYYTLCSFPHSLSRFRIAVSYFALVCATWMIFFATSGTEQWMIYVAGTATGLVVAIVLFALTCSKVIFEKNFLVLYIILALFFSLLFLLAFVPSTVGVSSAFNASLIVQLLLTIYINIPLRLWQVMLICGPVSIMHVVLSCTVCGKINSRLTCIYIILHCCIHMIGFVQHILSQVRRRSTFMRLGHSALMRKALEREQQTQNEMIQSLMPQKVAHEVMQGSYNSEDEEANEDEGDNELRMVGFQKGKKDVKATNLGKRNVKEGKSASFSDDTDDYSAEESEPLKGTEGSTSRREHRGHNPDVRVVSSSNLSRPPAGHAVKFRKFHVSQMENVSILFADIVGFTNMSSNKSASQLLLLLNDLFGRFDSLCELNQCEKIATLGDCYYCVSGCPNSVPDHAERIVEMGRSMCVAIQQFDDDHAEQVNMRVGVHTGKVICGLVGTRRFKFDVWSNDVTLANQMESSGQAGKVHISETTLEFVKDIYEVSDGEPVPDIRKVKVLIEYYNKEDQRYAIKHTQDQALIKTYFIERRFDNKPIIMIDKPKAPVSVNETNNAPPFVKDQPKASVDQIITSPTGSNELILATSPGSDEPEVRARGSDVEMLDALWNLSKPEEVFKFPPISRFSLCFLSQSLEQTYRRQVLCVPRQSVLITLATPRLTPVTNGLAHFLFFLLVSLACFINFPNLTNSQLVLVIPFVVFALALCFNCLFIAIVFSDLLAWGGFCPPAKRLLQRIYRVLFSWYVRNIIGVLILCSPAAFVLANFQICLFWFSRSADVAAVADFSTGEYPRELSTSPIWLAAAESSLFPWEMTVILILNLILIFFLNRNIDISFRVSFNRDFEASRAKKAISREKMQGEWLLENIIPRFVLTDLRKTNKYSQHVTDAAVMFASIANFSEFYDEQYQGGQEMLRVLNEIFADFEHLLSSVKFKDVEKIKTIAECFMAASGLNLVQRAQNTSPDDHLCALMDFAIELLKTLDDFNRQMFNFQFELKIGYNIGEVTAGVIGTTKLLYDIWGDTVNVASRMYSTGQKGRVQVTEEVARRLANHYEFEYRGNVFVKGKGEMRTHLLVGRKAQTS